MDCSPSPLQFPSASSTGLDRPRAGLRGGDVGNEDTGASASTYTLFLICAVVLNYNIIAVRCASAVDLFFNDVCQLAICEANSGVFKEKESQAKTCFDDPYGPCDSQLRPPLGIVGSPYSSPQIYYVSG
jgi:hypothetical protein